MTLNRFSIVLEHSKKFSISVEQDLKKMANELVNVLMKLPANSNELLINNSTIEFCFNLISNEKNELIDQLIENYDYISLKKISNEKRKELVSNNRKLINKLFDLSLKPIDGNQLFDLNEKHEDSLNKISTNDLRVNENTIDKTANHFYFDESTGKLILNLSRNKQQIDKVPEYADIWEAIQKKDLKAVDYFIRIKNIDPNSKRYWNRTCLHSAARSGSLELVKYLVSNGADINARDDDSNLPLHEACLYGHLEIVKYFITYLKMDLNSKGWSNLTCLNIADLHGKFELVKYLLKQR